MLPYWRYLYLLPYCIPNWCWIGLCVTRRGSVSLVPRRGRTRNRFLSNHWYQRHFEVPSNEVSSGSSCRWSTSGTHRDKVAKEKTESCKSSDQQLYEKLITAVSSCFHWSQFPPPGLTGTMVTQPQCPVVSLGQDFVCGIARVLCDVMPVYRMF